MEVLTPGNVFTLWSLFCASRASRRLKYVTKQQPLNNDQVRTNFYRIWNILPAHACGFVPQDVQLVNGTKFAEEFTQLLLKGRYIEKGSKKETGWEQINVETGSLHPSIWELDRQTSWLRLDLVPGRHRSHPGSRFLSSAGPAPPSRSSSSSSSWA